MRGTIRSKDGDTLAYYRRSDACADSKDDLVGDPLSSARVDTEERGNSPANGNHNAT